MASEIRLNQKFMALVIAIRLKLTSMAISN